MSDHFDQMITPIFVALLVFNCSTRIYAVAGRCYLCSEASLAECIGDTHVNSAIYQQVLRYYTEPCNGQCVQFRDANNGVQRGCSWTYGHMQAKSMGWHEISTGILAFFCDTPLCNHGLVHERRLPSVHMFSLMPGFDLHLFPIRMRQSFSMESIHRSIST
jgi:hypothetical protein